MGKLLTAIAVSIPAAIAGALFLAAGEAILNGDGLYQQLTSAGLVAIFAAPAALGLALVVRLLLEISRPKDFFTSFTDEDGSAPRLVALALVAVASPLVLGAATFLVSSAILSRTRQGIVIALGTALSVAAIAGLVVLLILPVYRLLCRLTTWLEGRRETTLFTLRRIAIAALVIVVAAASLTWFLVVRPAVYELDITPLVLAAVACGVLAAAHWGYSRLNRRRKKIAAISAVVALGALISVAVHARYADADTVLEIWAEHPVAGTIVATIWDPEDLVEARHRAAIAPKPLTDQHPDIVLITIDSIRPDRLSIYGGPVKTPTFERLAAAGTMFEWAFSAGNVTRRSLATIATGLSPHRARGRISGWALKLDPRLVTVAERLRAAGYDTAGFAWKARFFGKRRFGRGLDHAEFTAGDREVARVASQWMRKRQREAASPPKPAFVWIHLFDTHGWHLKGKNKPRPPKGLKTRERRLWQYDRALVEVDKVLGALIDPRYETRNPAGRIYIITADHAEGLGDHGQKHHSTDLYNSQIRVPLLIIGPNIVNARIEQPVGHADLAPTILALAGYEPITMPEADGVSLLPMLRGRDKGDPEGGRVHASMVVDRYVKSRADAIIVGRTKLITKNNRHELYDLASDPNELNDLAADRPRDVARLLKVLGELQRREGISPTRKR